MAAVEEMIALQQSSCFQDNPDPRLVSSKRSISETEDYTDITNDEEQNIEETPEKCKRGRFGNDSLPDTTATFVWDDRDDRDSMYPSEEYQPLKPRPPAQAAKLVFTWIKRSEADIKAWDSILDHFLDTYRDDSSQVFAHLDMCLTQPQNLKDLKALKARLEQINNYGTNGLYHQWDFTRVSNTMASELRKSCGEIAEIAGRLTTYSNEVFDIFDDITAEAEDFCRYTSKVTAVRELESGATARGKRDREDD